MDNFDMPYSDPSPALEYMNQMNKERENLDNNNEPGCGGLVVIFILLILLALGIILTS